MPWIIEDKPVCQSVAVQMIAAHYGIHRSRAEIDFLMGFTYGAGYRADWGFLTVGVDPETGMAFAAGYLGLALRYEMTDDAGLFVAALKAGLAADHPIRVPLDMGTLYGQDEPLPHNEVLVGYDPAGFWYYEPISLPPAPCPPGRHDPGAQGLHVDTERLLAAVQRQSGVFGYPWRYAMVSFAPTSTRTDVRAVWRKNGQALVGGSRWGQRWGAAATEHVAALIEDGAAPVAVAERGVTLGMITRPDNAAYLRHAYPGAGEIVQAAKDFDDAALAYLAASRIISTDLDSTNARQRLAGHLREAATSERRAGRRFLHHASDPSAIPAMGAPT